MRAALLALCLVATGCEVIVLGDSNSCNRLSNSCLEKNNLWPLELSMRKGWPHWTVRNRSVSGLAAGHYRDVLRSGDPNDGMWHLERLIREDLADACLPLIGRLVVRRKLVIALGTNDIGPPFGSGMNAGAAVLALYERASRVPCVDVYVATIPPKLLAPEDAGIANRMILTGVPRSRIIPFGDEPVTDVGEDGIHIKGDAQYRRADMAAAVLFRWF